MKKFTLILSGLVAVFALNACIPDYTGDTTYDYSTDNSQVDYGSGTVLICDNSECTAAPAEYTDGDGNATVGVYSADYNQIECGAAGFFWCTIENMCLNQSITTGSCN